MQVQVQVQVVEELGQVEVVEELVPLGGRTNYQNPFSSSTWLGNDKGARVGRSCHPRIGLLLVLHMLVLSAQHFFL